MRLVALLFLAFALLASATPQVPTGQERPDLLIAVIVSLILLLFLVFGLAVNIALRFKSERDLKESEARYRALFDDAGDAIAICDLNGKFLEANQVFCKDTGYTLTDILKMNIGDVTTPERALQIQNKLEAAFDKGSLLFEGIILHRDGHSFPVEVNGRKIIYKDKPAILGVVRDITTRKKTEEEHARLEDQLRHAHKMEAIGQLAGGIAHDLNNLLTPILGNTELLLLASRGQTRQHDQMLQIQRSALRARELTKQLLAFGRKQLLELKPIYLNVIIESFEKILRRTIREDIDITTSLASTWPTRGDTGQIEQILLNLSLNAQDAMKHGGSLTISTENLYIDDSNTAAYPNCAKGEYISLHIKDSGIGMDKQTVERIFEPFFTTKEPGKGVGLGLATVYGIVRQHDGYIWVDSELNKGSKFTLLFPRCQDTPAIAEEAPVSTGPYGNETILIVEDDPMVRKLAHDILALHGYNVFDTGKTSEAIELFKSRINSIKLLLTDVVMPEMNGRELFETLQQLKIELKVVYMSGYSGTVISHRGILEEGINFIQKPFSIATLTTKIRTVLDATS